MEDSLAGKKRRIAELKESLAAKLTELEEELEASLADTAAEVSTLRMRSSVGAQTLNPALAAPKPAAAVAPAVAAPIPPKPASSAAPAPAPPLPVAPPQTSSLAQSTVNPAPAAPKPAAAAAPAVAAPVTPTPAAVAGGAATAAAVVQPAALPELPKAPAVAAPPPAQDATPLPRHPRAAKSASAAAGTAPAHAVAPPVPGGAASAAAAVTGQKGPPASSAKAPQSVKAAAPHASSTKAPQPAKVAAQPASSTKAPQPGKAAAQPASSTKAPQPGKAAAPASSTKAPQPGKAAAPPVSSKSPAAVSPGGAAGGDAPDDGNVDYCDLCEAAGGLLVCCDRCPRAFHLKCLRISSAPKGEWKCPECVRTFGTKGEHETEAGSLTGPVVTRLFPGPFLAPRATRGVEAELRLVVEALRDHEFAPAFLAPVNAEAVPGYAAVVKQPRDLGSIQKALRGGRYGTGAAFDAVRVVADLRLVFHNCRWFNKPLSTIWRMADVLSRELETALRDRVKLSAKEAERLETLRAVELSASALWN